jgi:heat shock protein HslJ
MAVGLLAIAVLAACGPGTQPVEPASLSGSSWILTGVAVEGEDRPSIDDNASLTFGIDGTIAGSTGCNRFTGGWDAEADRLTIAPGPMTLRACPGELATQEAAVLTALGATAAYRSDGQTLALLDADGAALAQYRSAAVDLAGTAWRATGVNNGRGGVESTPGTGNLSLAFASNGTLSGFDGCGAFAGTFTCDGALIHIAAASANSCADPRQRPYIDALRNARTWRVDGNRLELRDDSGALQVGLVQD